MRNMQHVTTRAHWQCITSLSNTCIEHTDSRTSARAIAHTVVHGEQRRALAGCLRNTALQGMPLHFRAKAVLLCVFLYHSAYTRV